MHSRRYPDDDWKRANVERARVALAARETATKTRLRALALAASRHQPQQPDDVPDADDSSASQLRRGMLT